MESKVIKYAKEIFKTDNVSLEDRLLGGMSNYSYVIKVDEKKYTIRIPGEYDTYFVNREYELRDLFLFTSLNLTNRTVYFNINNGVKASVYVDGDSLNTCRSLENTKKVSELLKKVHNSNILCETNYEPFKKLERYENNLKELNIKNDNRYYEIKNEFLKHQSYLESQKLVLCHNDSQPSNFILNRDNELLIVDFEFVGNNDYLYDIACYGNMDMKDAVELLKIYHEEKISNDVYKRFYLWRAFQCLQWYNVALFKDIKGMSKTLNLDFYAISLRYLDKAYENLTTANKFL